MFTLCIAKPGSKRLSLFFQGTRLDQLDESEYEMFHLLNKKPKKWLLNSLSAVEMHKNCSNKYMPLTLMK